MAYLPLVDAHRSLATTPSPAETPRATTRVLAARFEAQLLQSAFAPLAKAMGFYGDAVVAVAAEAMFRGGGDALTDPLEAALSAAARGGSGP